MLKKKLNKGIWPMVILFLVCMLSTALLALTNHVTADTIAARTAEAALATRQALFPEAVSFEPLEIPAKYQDDKSVDPALHSMAEAARDQNGNLLGLLIRSHRKGYGGQVPLYLALDPTGNIVGIHLPANGETPGLGQRVREEKFWSQFLGHRSDESFSARDSKGSRIDAVSGATVSSEAVSQAVNDAIDIFKQLIEGVR